MKISEDIYLIGSGKLGFDWTHPADCNVYLLDTGEGLVLIDSGTGLSVRELEQNMTLHGFDPRQLSYVLLTHLHADHSGGAAEIQRRTGAKVAVLNLAAPILRDGHERSIDLDRARDAGYYPKDYRWKKCSVDRELIDGECMGIGRYTFNVMYSPGHSRYDTCFYVQSADRPAILISGDTVMYGGKISMLNTSDFHMGSLARSIERLSGLEPRILLPGHGQPALDRAYEHVRSAHKVFSQLGIPTNI